MKKKQLSIAFGLLLLLSSANAFAQGAAPAAPSSKWVPTKGYWIVESNVKVPRQATLYFYNNENLLVYKEKVDGVKLNLKRRKTKLQLKRILDQSLALYEERKRAGENEMLARSIILRN